MPKFKRDFDYKHPSEGDEILQEIRENYLYKKDRQDYDNFGRDFVLDEYKKK